MTSDLKERVRSPVSQRAAELVADRRAAAEELGRALAERTGDPDDFTRTLADGFRALADPDYQAGQHRVAPGLGPVFGVRWPLIEAVKRGFREETRRERTGQWLFLVDRLFREQELEFRWFAFGLLERLVLDDPERSWQLLRRAAREADDWITVDALAHPIGKAILREPYRWAELEQLVFSASRWERRLVGSTIATLPFVDRRAGRSPDVARHGLDLIDNLIGDAEPDVQKALAWALRSLTLVDREAVARFCDREAQLAAETSDGHRAWVIRDVLPKLSEDRAAAIRGVLMPVRRRTGAPSTSRASATAAGFSGAIEGFVPPEPPLT
ncbi:MAG: DNA alkylation repair protein [Chloroflexi bacterium]|nr:MAG: DNA alkylation repair protein [Chloroflexota bacterium]